MMKFNVPSVIYCITCLVLLCVGPFTAAQSVEEVILKYRERVEQARRLQASVQMEFFPQFKSEIVDEMKPELESVYSLPVEDPIYTISPLYFISNAMLKWDMILNGFRMSVAQQTLSSDIRLSRMDSRRPERIESIRRLHAPPSSFVDFSFSYDSTEPSRDFPRWHLIAPPELLNWHFIPNLWYPSLRQIGLSEFMEEIELRRGGFESYLLMYTPRNLDESLMDLLREVSANPNLQERDLLNVLVIDPNTFACLSFDICIEEEDKRKYLMKVHNSPSGSTVDGLPYPSSTSISVITRVWVEPESENSAEGLLFDNTEGIIEGEYIWGELYYGQMNFTHVEKVD